MIYQQFKNLDDYLSTITAKVVIINDLSFFEKETLEGLPTLLSTTYEVDTINTLPSCICGETKAAWKEGKICTVCNTEVIDPFGKVEPTMWLRKLGKDKLLSPNAWNTIKSTIGGSVDMLRWLSDSSYNPPKGLPVWAEQASDLIGGRTYHNMVTRLEDLLVFILNTSQFRTSTNKVTDMELLIPMVKENKDMFMSEYLALPSKRLFVSEKTAMGNYTNLLVGSVIDLTLSYIKAASNIGAGERRISNITGRTISKLAAVFNDLNKTFLASKPGLFRKQVYGVRSPFTARTVITSIMGPHRYDEIHLPWQVGVVCFRPHLLNTLYKAGYRHKVASRMLFDAVTTFNPIVYKHLEALITNSSHAEGIPIGMQRNQYIGFLYQ